MVIEIELFESGGHSSLDFCLWVGWRTKFTKETRRIAFWMLLPA